MATLEQRKDHFRIIFFYKNKRYAQSLHTDNLREAETLKGGIEERLMRLNQGLVELRTDLIDYVVKGINTPEEQRIVEPPAEKLSFAKLRDSYLDAYAFGAMEENSLNTVKMHLRHFAETLGYGTTGLLNIHRTTGGLMTVTIK